MAHTKVFVDDFVTGDLPPVCVVSGERAWKLSSCRARRDVASPGFRLLRVLVAIFLFPFGLLVFLISTHRSITGWIPVSPAVREQLDRRAANLRRLLLVVPLLAGAAIGAAAAGPVVGWALLLLAIGLTVTVAAVHLDNPARPPRVELDDSLRWVGIDRAHPDFCAAVDRSQCEGHRTRGRR